MVVVFASTWWHRMINPCSLVIHLCVGTSMRCWQIAPVLKLLSQASTFGFLSVLPSTVVSKSNHCKWKSTQISFIVLWQMQKGDTRGEVIYWRSHRKQKQERTVESNCCVMLSPSSSSESLKKFSKLLFSDLLPHGSLPESQWGCNDTMEVSIWCPRMMHSTCTFRCGFEECLFPFQNSHQVFRLTPS